MVLESLLTPTEAEHTPYKTVFLGFIYCTVSLFLSYFVFRSYASTTMVFLTTMAALPLFFQTIILEEEKDVEPSASESFLLKEHTKALDSFAWLFLGMVLAFTLWYISLSADMIGILFKSQSDTINALNGSATGYLAQDIAIFSKIFLNNVRVLVFCVLFSFVYGAGAIFILTWNASVIGAAIGNIVRSGLTSVAHLVGLEKVGEYSQIIAYGLARYAIHGIPEILAYFVAGLAGGIISIAIIRRDAAGRKLEHILLDSADLLLISLLLVFIAGVLEVRVTPVLF